MTDAIDLTTEQRTMLSALLRRFLPGVAVWAYGSRVKWTARPNSDLDLVAFTAPAQRPQVSDLKDALAESNLPFPVDLHVWDDVPERFREIIRQEYVVVQEAKEAERKTSIPGEWLTLTVDQIKANDDRAIAIGPFGSRMKADAYVAKGVPVVRGNNISDTRVFVDDFVFVSDETADELRSCNVFAGDLVFPHRGSIGQVGIIPDDGTPRYMLSTSLMKLTCNRELVDPQFIFYFFRSAAGRHSLLEHASTVGTPGIGQPLTSLRSIRVPIPPIDEQHVIAHILGTLDDKIELNRRMNETLEAMARALFKSWFIDCDPVRAKAEGRDPGLPKPIADLFPSRLVDSDLGEIPEGWEVGKLGDIAEHPRRGVQPNSIAPDTAYIALEHMPRRCIALSDWGTADGLGSNKFEFHRGELLFGKLRPYFHKVGVAPLDGVCSTDIVVVAPHAQEWFGFTLGHVSSDAFVEHTNAGSTGTKMPRTSWSDMARYTVVIPPQNVAKAFTSQIRPVVDQIIASIHESRTLAALRDTLLPKLISGELRVKNGGT
ncbi:MAG: restriction endonuclease subunit S [Nitrospira sp. LK70]|nr:restriction endonuclease subunit S [Nitrospira sp. LK70]